MAIKTVRAIRRSIVFNDSWRFLFDVSGVTVALSGSKEGDPPFHITSSNGSLSACRLRPETANSRIAEIPQVITVMLLPL